MKTARGSAWSLVPLGQAVIELLYFLPIMLASAVYLLPESAIWPWIATLPLCYWLGSMLMKLLPKQRRIINILLAGITGIAHSCLITLWLFDSPVYSVIICSLLGAISAGKGMLLELKGWEISFPNVQLLIGVILYVVIQPLKYIMLTRLIDYNAWLIYLGILAVIVLFIFSNERHLNNETADTVKSPVIAAFKRHNRIMMVAVISIMTIIAMFRHIQQAIEGFIRGVIGQIVEWLSSPPQEQVSQPVQEPAPLEMPGADEIKPPAEWMVLLEQIFKILVTVLLIIAAAVILFFLLRKLYRLVQRIAARLLERGADSRRSETGYTDEVESMMSLISLRKQMGMQLRKLLPKKRPNRPGWNELDSNAERIRFLYAHFIRSMTKGGDALQTHLTPRETLEHWKQQNGKTVQNKSEVDGLIDSYEQVRYGEKTVSDELVSKFKQQLYREGK